MLWRRRRALPLSLGHCTTSSSPPHRQSARDLAGGKTSPQVAQRRAGLFIDFAPGSTRRRQAEAPLSYRSTARPTAASALRHDLQEGRPRAAHRDPEGALRERRLAGPGVDGVERDTVGLGHPIHHRRSQERPVAALEAQDEAGQGRSLPHRVGAGDARGENGAGAGGLHP
jgi:hypothetical protein